MCSHAGGPKDGRYGENPNRLQHYYQFQVILKPSPPDLQDLYFASLKAIGIDTELHDIRFVEDDWESPTLGAWGLGWECWCDGMEVSQFTYFQQVAGVECAPVAGELTYGLERLACYLQGVDRIMDLNFNGGEGDARVTYGDVFLQAEQEYSRFNFEAADTNLLLRHFRDAEGECHALLDKGDAGTRHLLALPAYDQCIKASHVFNLLDARGVISVTERQGYILRVRELAKACGAAWMRTAGSGGGARDRAGDKSRDPTRHGVTRSFNTIAGPVRLYGRGLLDFRTERKTSFVGGSRIATVARNTPRNIACGLPTLAAPATARRAAGGRVRIAATASMRRSPTTGISACARRSRTPRAGPRRRGSQ